MSLLRKTLERLFREPIVILMLGDWRTGKTDTSLLIAHLAKKWGIIDKIGSNIYTYDNPDVDYITSVNGVKKWLHADRSEKLFILDEALKYAYRRKAMSLMNVDIITEILPELSKGHGRVILCSQIEKLDTDLLHPAFCRARFIKVSKKVMLAYSKYWKRARRFINLPKSPIKFDMDRIAKFVDRKLSKESKKINKGRLYEIAKMRVEGFTYSEIGDKFNLHPEQLKREINKVLKFFVEYADEIEEPKDFVNKIERTPFEETTSN